MGRHPRELIDVHHLDELDAEHWLARWEREAGAQRIGRHSHEFWQEGGAWIMEQRRTRCKPYALA